MHRTTLLLTTLLATPLLAIAGCDQATSSTSTSTTTETASTPRTAPEAAATPASAPEPEAPEPEAPAPEAPAPEAPPAEPAAEPASDPEPTTEEPASGPVVEHLPGTAPINGTMKPLAGHPGFWVADIAVVEVPEGEAPPAAITEESIAVSINMTAWNMHGDHGHQLVSRIMVIPIDDQMVFPGWDATLQGMRIGDSRKLWAGPGTFPSEQMAQGAPVVFDLRLEGIDEFINVPEADKLPGEPVGEAAVQTSPTGLKWYDVVEGEGDSPGPTDRVKVHYTGWLVDGTEFDSSKKSGVPFTVNMQGGVIQGWLEGLQTMKAGGTRKLIIPENLAYGWNPRPGSPIPPGATLIFDVEMLEIENPDAPADSGGGK